MAVIKQGPAPEDHYTMIPNTIARSATLPPRAKAVYIFIRSHRTGWDLSTDRIAESLAMSPTTVKSALKDLEAEGFVERKRLHNEDGTFSSWEYTVYSEPVTMVQNLSHGPWYKKPTVEKTYRGLSDPLKKTIPLKKTVLQEEQPPIVPQRGTDADAIPDLFPEDSASAKTKNSYPEEFEKWWSEYPLKKGKGVALKKWRLAVKDVGSADELLRRLRDRLPALMETHRRDPRFVPHPATWLTQGRYDDPVENVLPPESPMAAWGATADDYWPTEPPVDEPVPTRDDDLDGAVIDVNWDYAEVDHGI